MGSIRKYEYILTNLINLLKYKFTILAPNWGQNYYLIEVINLLRFYYIWLE